MYQAPRALVARDRWIDGPSANIPALYLATGVILADILRAKGDERRADTVLALTDSVARATRLNHWFSIPLPSEMLRVVPADTAQRGTVPLQAESLSRGK